jgi:hypothetical protein
VLSRNLSHSAPLLAYGDEITIRGPEVVAKLGRSAFKISESGFALSSDFKGSWVIGLTKIRNNFSILLGAGKVPLSPFLLVSAVCQRSG